MGARVGVVTAFLKTAVSGVRHLCLPHGPMQPVAPLPPLWHSHPIYFRSQEETKAYPYTIQAYEELTGLHYTPVLTAENSATERLVRKRCRQLLEGGQLTKSALWYGTYYRPALRQATVADVYISWAGSVKAWGLFARVPLAAATFVGEYTGQLALLSCFFRKINPYCFRYPLPLSHWLWFTIDAELYGNETRFLNHNDQQPNCTAHVVYCDGLLRVIICTLRAVAKDEELTYNYGLTLWGQQRIFEEIA